MPASHVCYAARSVLRGLKCLHARGLAHGELHAGHVFVNSRGEVKVGAPMVATLRVATGKDGGSDKRRDTGTEEGKAMDEAKQDRRGSPSARGSPGTSVSRKLTSSEESGVLIVRNTLPPEGSAMRDPPWLAPEATLSSTPTAATDVWSFGALLLQMASGASSLSTMRRLAEQVCRRPNEALNVADIDSALTSEFASLAALCLRSNPEERPSVEELLGHIFFADACLSLGSSQGFAEWIQSECDGDGVALPRTQQTT
jgi:serine/threonine protein kinase